MALNLKTFQTRTLTAIIFAAVMLIGLLWNHWSFLILFSIIHFGCWWEYFNLVEKIHQTSINRYLKLGFMLSGFAIMIWFSGPAFEINNYHLKENISFPLSVSGFVFLAMGIFQSKKNNLKVFGIVALGLIYISLCWGLMLSLRQYGIIFKGNMNYLDYGFILPAILIFSIWVNDTMAYIVGSMIGKTPLSEVSPKKTWEGTIGGFILSVGLIGWVGWLINFSVTETMIIASLSSIFGTIGDLLQSKLKRMAGVKDSGNFMPGHGGFLDRFDSMLLATPAVWLYVVLFMK